MSYQHTLDIPAALDAMERNIRAIIIASGHRAAYVRAQQTTLGTASISHYLLDGAIHCTVNFPVLPVQYRISKLELDRWTGYFLHEVSHALWTDPQAWKKAVNEGLHKLVNGLEDPRIERNLYKAALAINSPDIIRALVRFVAQRGEAERPCDPNESKNLPWTFALIGRAHLGLDTPEAAVLYGRLHEPMKGLVDKALAGLKASTSTLDILKLARELCGRNPETGEKPTKVEPLDEGIKVNPGVEREPEPDDGEEGDDLPWNDDNDGRPSDDAGDAGEPDGEPELNPEDDRWNAWREKASEDDGDGDGDGDGDDLDVPGNGGGQGGRSDGGGRNAPGGKASDAPAEIDPGAMEDISLDPMSDASKEMHAKTTANYSGHDQIWLGEAIRGAAKRTARGILKTEGLSRADYSDVQLRAQKAGMMRQQVARVIKSVESELYDRHRPSGRLDRHALAGVGAGIAMDNVYAKREVSEGYDTTVTVLCDGSSSMQGAQRLMVTASLALAIAQACDQQGVTCEVLQFRSDGLRMIKPANGRVDKMTLPAFGRLSREATGGTPLSESMISAAHRLVERGHGKRKILFCITDGGCDQGGSMVRKASDYVESMGVETVGLSIDSEVHGAFRLESAIDSYGDVARAGLGNLVRIMEGARS